MNDQKGFYHCFASGEHGDIFKFLMTDRGLDLSRGGGTPGRGGWRFLAAARCPSMKPRRRTRRACSMRMEEACRFFQASLSSREGDAARDLSGEAGLRAAEIQAFRLGYAPDSKSAPEKPSEPEGLYARRDARGRASDPWRGYRGPLRPLPRPLDFSDLDAKRRVIAFGGRALFWRASSPNI